MRRAPLVLALLCSGLGFAACLGRAALEPIGPPEEGSGGDAGSTTTPTGTGVPTTTSSSTITTSTTSTTTTTTWPLCDGTGDCGACAECALGGACYDSFQACTANAACIAFGDCFDTCWDADPWSCFEQCGADNPEGYSLFYAMLDCLSCQQCPSDCWEYSSWLCFWEQR